MEESGHTAAGQAWTEWAGPAIGLLDLDAFFASVEQLDHPEWRGRPVVVGGSVEKRGVVSTASYEARRFGIHSAMPAAEARRLCPEAIWTQGHFERYRAVSNEVMGIILDETPLVEQVSVDEAFFDVTPGRFSRESPLDICRRIQRRVSDLGVTCSIGLGTNKTVAKVASERDKPRGLTVVFPGGEADFLAPLPIRAMSGIGPATERRLHGLGIKTLGQLAASGDRLRAEEFGVLGPLMVERAAGAERSVVPPSQRRREVKSVSNERTFAHDLTDAHEVHAALDHICGLVGRRLRDKSLAGSVVTVKVRFDYLHARSAQRRLPHPADDEREFSPVAREALDQIWREGQPVRLLGVAMSGFGEEAAEPDLLDLLADEEGRPSVSRTTDEIRRRFGDDAVAYGHDLRFSGRTSDTQPMGKGDDD
ncbi:MAG: DNA polymerase IV [Atopobiaceae bacterium]|jgi:DNA polymerase-4|nr:DNA polymerase IV [Atopobiaceae bacterium]